ncbi:MAG TPA: hypothetical protein VLV48_01825, partial [Thermoanaerobaculia bacterium]|nr:hypothetical protein [Thermoanaerobaculia bacterium]
MRRSLALVLGMLLLLLVPTGCKLKKAAEEAAISDNLEDVGTKELLEKTSEDSYDPPADGRLTDGQIQMYLKVREKEKAIALVARKELEAKAKKSEEKGGDKSLAGMMAGFEALGSAADFLTADIRAANELGFNTAEYQWVKEQVLEASGAAFAESMAQSTQAMMDQAYNEMKKQHDEATDADAKKALAGMLAEYDKNRKEMAAQQEKVDPSVKHNRDLLAKYENALNALA